MGTFFGLAGARHLHGSVDFNSERYGTCTLYTVCGCGSDFFFPPRKMSIWRTGGLKGLTASVWYYIVVTRLTLNTGITFIRNVWCVNMYVYKYVYWKERGVRSNTTVITRTYIYIYIWHSRITRVVERKKNNENEIIGNNTTIVCACHSDSTIWHGWLYFPVHMKWICVCARYKSTAYFTDISFGFYVEYKLVHWACSIPFSFSHPIRSLKIRYLTFLSS